MKQFIKGFSKKLSEFKPVTISGKNGISAKIIADSINSSGSRLTTYELVYQRYIHSEFMTHRSLAKNSASSRAIPVNKMIEHIKQNPAMPIHWGKNQRGMQAKNEHNEIIELEPDRRNLTREAAWLNAMTDATNWARKFDKAGYHKQIVNRLIEPFKMMKVVCSGTEYDNFFWLRCHADAQPEIKELADAMYVARNKSIPISLVEGEYHLPYINSDIITECVKYLDETNKTNKTNKIESELDPIKVALKVSASCCAQVSYRTNDTSIEKAFKIYYQLVTSEPMHASPFEHQARPITDEDRTKFSQPLDNSHSAITHICKNKSYWSGNLKGWIQHRHEIPNNTCTKYL